MIKAAIYARYSSDLQSDASIEDQIRLATGRAAQEGWMITQPYTDHGISGASMLRAGMQMLMQDAMAGKFDIVLAEALDRLSRDQEDIAGIYKRMQFAGVKIITLSEGEITHLHIGLKGTMNALFLKDLADKTRRGLSGRIEKGKSGGGLSYGYDVVKQFDTHGEPMRGDRTINQAQALIVQRIFTDYAKGQSPLAIAKQLNKEHIAGPSSTGWTQSTINGNRERGTGILNNELYIGSLIWNRLRYIKDPDTGKRVSRLNPEAQWLKKAVPELRIIDDSLWHKVKERQGGLQRKLRLTDKQRPKALFSGLLKCGCCGGGFTKISLHHYGCFTARKKALCDNWNTIRQDAVENAVLHALEAHLMQPELCDAFCKEYARHMNQLRMAHNAQKQHHEAELKKRTRESERLLRMVMDGVTTGAVVKDTLNAHTARIEELTLLLADVQEAPVLLHPNMGLHYRKEVEALIASLNTPEHRHEAAEIIRSLIEKITLTPKPEGGLTIDLHGDLAGILTIAAGTKGSSTKELADQIQALTEPKKLEESNGLPRQNQPDVAQQYTHNPHMQDLLVAGAGFEPAAFRL